MPVQAFHFPIEWTCPIHDPQEIVDIRGKDGLSVACMRNMFGWGKLAGVTSPNIWIRPDVEEARKQGAISRCDLLKMGIAGVHYFPELKDAKSYFRALLVYVPLPDAAQ